MPGNRADDADHAQGSGTLPRHVPSQRNSSGYALFFANDRQIQQQADAPTLAQSREEALPHQNAQTNINAYRPTHDHTSNDARRHTLANEEPVATLRSELHTIFIK